MLSVFTVVARNVCPGSCVGLGYLDLGTAAPFSALFRCCFVRRIFMTESGRLRPKSSPDSETLGRL